MASESAKYDDIRPYRDDEVGPVIAGLIENDEFIDMLAHYRAPRLYKLAAPLLKPIARMLLKRRMGHIQTVQQLQLEVARIMNRMIEKSTSEVTYSGLDKLDRNQSYLFVSNHRDIALDPAFVNWGLHHDERDTVRIAIGDNLLKKPYTSDLMRLNKSFIVKRSAKGPREMMAAFAKLSNYIHDSLHEGHSVWIAQREGRAKDGNDLTDPAILKMFYMHGKKQKIPFSDYLRELNIVPVTISYEYDPGDIAKAKELEAIERDGAYQKAEFEDLESIVQGIVGDKGHVHISFGDPITEGIESPDQLATAIDQAILEGYHIHPSNRMANGDREGISAEDQAKFDKRFADLSDSLRERVMQMYAKPLQRRQ